MMKPCRSITNWFVSHRPQSNRDFRTMHQVKPILSHSLRTPRSYLNSRSVCLCSLSKQSLSSQAISSKLPYLFSANTSSYWLQTTHSKSFYSSRSTKQPQSPASETPQKSQIETPHELASPTTPTSTSESNSSNQHPTNQQKDGGGEAIEKIETPAEPQPKTDKIDPRVWPIAASAFLMGTAIGVIIPVMPLFARLIGLSPSDYGLVVAVMGFTRLVVNMPLAAVGDSLGRRPLLMCGPIGTSIAMIGTGFANSFSELMTWRFVTGVSGSAQMTGSQLYLADISHSGNRARTMAPMLSAWSSGVTIGPAVGGFLAEYYGLRAPFYLVGLAIAGVALNNMRLTETRPPGLPVKSHDTYLGAVVNSYSSAAKQWRILFKDRNIKAGVGMQTVYWFCMSGAQFTILPILGTDQFGFSMSAIGGMFGLMACINIVGSPVAAYVSDKIGRKYAMVPGALGVAAALSLLPFATTTSELMILLTLWGTGSCLWGSTPSAYITDLTSTESRSQALAMLRSAGDFGLMLGAAFSGFMLDMIGMDFALLANSSLLVGSAALFSVFASESAGHFKKIR